MSDRFCLCAQLPSMVEAIARHERRHKPAVAVPGASAPHDYQFGRPRQCGRVAALCCCAVHPAADDSSAVTWYAPPSAASSVSNTYEHMLPSVPMARPADLVKGQALEAIERKLMAEQAIRYRALSRVVSEKLGGCQEEGWWEQLTAGVSSASHALPVPQLPAPTPMEPSGSFNLFGWFRQASRRRRRGSSWNVNSLEHRSPALARLPAFSRRR